MKWFWQRSKSQAAQWFGRVRSGRIDSPSDAAWTEWMTADEAHTKAYENLELTWELAEEVRNRPTIQALLRDLDRGLSGTPQPARAKPGPFGLNITWQAGLATVVLCVVCVLAVVVVIDRPITAEYATNIGEQKTVTLADSSTIALNTGTRVRVTYSRSLRRIDLLEGEALFEVTKDTKRPFEVHALHGSATALGTEFDVCLTGTTAAVSVLKGTVKVLATEKPQNDMTAKISAGEAVDYSADGITSSIHKANVDKVRAWQAQRILIADESLAEALADYNRYTKIPITIGDPALASRHINGVFRIGDESAFLNALQQGLHLTVTHTDSSIVLLPR
jgi:transmembrane sensor